MRLLFATSVFCCLSSDIFFIIFSPPHFLFSISQRHLLEPTQKLRKSCRIAELEESGEQSQIEVQRIVVACNYLVVGGVAHVGFGGDVADVYV